MIECAGRSISAGSAVVRARVQPGCKPPQTWAGIGKPPDRCRPTPWNGAASERPGWKAAFGRYSSLFSSPGHKPGRPFVAAPVPVISFAVRLPGSGTCVGASWPHMSSASDPPTSSAADPERVSCCAVLRCGDALLRPGSALLDSPALRYTECARGMGSVPGSGASATDALRASQVGTILVSRHVAPGERMRDPVTTGRTGFVFARTRARPISGVLRSARRRTIGTALEQRRVLSRRGNRLSRVPGAPRSAGRGSVP